MLCLPVWKLGDVSLGRADVSIWEGAQCSSSSRGSGFPLPLTHRPELCFYPGCLVEVYPLRRAYILFSLTIQVWIPSPTTLQTHLDIVWTYISAPHDPVKLSWRTNHHSFILTGFQLGCFFGGKWTSTCQRFLLEKSVFCNVSPLPGDRLCLSTGQFFLILTVI